MTKSISFDAFKKLAVLYSAVPIYETLVFDTYSPLSAFYHFKDNDNYVFLEGVSSDEQHSRYSYLALVISKSKYDWEKKILEIQS